MAQRLSKPRENLQSGEEIDVEGLCTGNGTTHELKSNGVS
jgi:hypothetical protein